MTPITDVAVLVALYDAPAQTALDTVARCLTPLCTRWIAALTGRLEQRGKHPRCVVALAAAEVYFQSASLWQREGDAWPFIPDHSDGFDAQGDIDGFAEYAKTRMGRRLAA